MPVEIRMLITGVTSAITLLKSIPGGIILPTVDQTMKDMVAHGVDLMAMNILQSIRTEKSRGVLAESIQGFVDRTKGTIGDPDGAWVVEIGSALPYAKFVAGDIKAGVINQNVLLQTGKWVWIGARPAIPGHNFLEKTLQDLQGLMPTLLNGHFVHYTGEVQRIVDSLRNVSP